MTTQHKFLITALFFAFFLFLNRPALLANSPEDSLRRVAIKGVIPNLRNLAGMQNLVRLNPESYSGVKFLLDLDSLWLEKAHFASAVSSDWTGYRNGNGTDGLDLFEEYAHYTGKLYKVTAFFSQGDVAILVLNGPVTHTAVILNRGKKQVKEHGTSIHIEMLSLSQHQAVSRMKPKSAYAPTRQFVAKAVQGTYVSGSHKTLSQIRRAEPLAIVRDSTVFILGREWKVFTAGEIQSTNEDAQMAYRIMAFDQKGIPGYFTMEKLDEVWQLTVKLEQSDKLGRDTYLFQGYQKTERLNSCYRNLGLQGFFVLGITLGGVTLLRNRSLKRQRTRAQLALTGLRARLNPHFLFNALGSIQDLMNQMDLAAANRYFTDMAQLLRYVVDSAADEFTPLSDELTALEKYCSLEALRTPFRFLFHIRPEVNLDNIEVPTMLLQPFVENAIIHGLRQGEAPKELTVNVAMESADRLGISIEDTGIGIEEAQLRNQAHPSKRNHQGMAITHQRIDLLNLGKREKITLNIRDRRQLQPDLSGTIVQLSIPI